MTVRSSLQSTRLSHADGSETRYLLHEVGGGTGAENVTQECYKTKFKKGRQTPYSAMDEFGLSLYILRRRICMD